MSLSQNPFGAVVLEGSSEKEREGMWNSDGMVHGEGREECECECVLLVWWVCI